MLNKIFRTYKTAFSGLSRENWLLSFVMLINRMGTMAAVFMSVYVTQSLKRSLSEAGLVITLFGAGAVLGALSGGVLVKKFGFRFTQIVTSLITGVLYIIFAKTENFHYILVLAVIIGLVSEAFRPANFTAIAHYSKPELITKSYSLNRFAINLGMGLGTGLGGILASIDYHLLFIVEGFTNIAVGILILTLLPSAKKLLAKKPEQKLDSSKIKSPWKDSRFLKFMAVNLFYISSFLMMFKFAPVFWKEAKHIDESAIGIILALNGIIIAIFEMVLVQHLQTRKRDLYYIFLGIIMAAVSYAFLVFSIIPAVVAVVLSVLFLTISEMLALPFVNTFVVESSGAENRGSYASVYTLTWSLSGIIAPALGAFIADHFSYNTLWITLTIICLIIGFYMKNMFDKTQNATLK